MKTKKVAIILTPESGEQIPDRLEEIDSELKDLKITFSDENIEDINISLKVYVQMNIPAKGEDVMTKTDLEAIFVQLPLKNNPASRKNIGRQLVPEDTEILLFLDESVKITRKLVLDRIKPLAVEKLAGITGFMGEPISDEMKKELLDSLKNVININEDSFRERCLLEDGRVRYVDSKTMATSTKVWDLIGGLNLKSKYPTLEYCGRVQALGYGVILQAE